MPSTNRKPRKDLLADQLAPTLEEKCAAYLAKGLPPNADEFDRVCYEGMARYMELIDPELVATYRSSRGDMIPYLPDWLKGPAA